MGSYQTWFGEGPELSVLRMLGLFDRPADEKAVGALLKSPAIRGLTESLTDLSPTEWRTILAKLRRAALLAPEDPHNPGNLDTHPLVREYFGEQLRSQQTDAWRECNKRLYHYYRTLAPQLPNNFREMEPLFLAVICACNAGLFREALHEVYIPRMQRGTASFAANVLGARGALLSVLIHFFEGRRWGSPVQTSVEEQSLTTGFHRRFGRIISPRSLVWFGACRVFVLVTLRSDFYPRYQEFPDLIELAKPSGKFDGMRPRASSSPPLLIRLRTPDLR
jgi:hypothetical protein